MSEINLFIYPGRHDLPSPSPPCCKVFLALKYSQLPHTVTSVKGDPKKLSPSGRLPALMIGGDTICDSVEILDRLELSDPPRHFWPTDPREYARDRVWERFANEHLYWRTVYLRWQVPENFERTCASFLGRMPMLARLILPRIILREVRGRLNGQGIGKQPLSRVRADVTKAFDTYEAGIGDGPYLEQRREIGRADLAAAAGLPQLAYEGITPWAGAELLKRKKLVDYIARVYEACDQPVPRCMRTTA